MEWFGNLVWDGVIEGEKVVVVGGLKWMNEFKKTLEELVYSSLKAQIFK